ncbi:MAG: isoprenylcysteine carboxylmethyltransferase family protein [Chloroflexi bacterium]|nr:MAG: isoprenylcysteine carboxylmethyltransferase family protein [Chloroflexota bacterium]MCE7860412.1 isoprenylcysteine carboxylmethyltransferase family protein [Chloroflexi bacterium CFX2]
MEAQMSRSKLLMTVLSRLFGGAIMFALLFFLPAGTWRYWQAWMYIGILFIPMLFVLAYFMKNDPGLLERRMKMREERSEQRRIIGLSALTFILAYIIPGFDIRFGWSNMPAWISILAGVILFLSYLLVFRTMQVNSFLSRVIEVAENQKVVDTDVYGWVRHPMYVGMTILYVVSPIVLGSWWAVIPALVIIPVIVFRILDEEKALENELAGYKEYKQKVRYRLIPFVW